MYLDNTWENWDQRHKPMKKRMKKKEIIKRLVQSQELRLVTKITWEDAKGVSQDWQEEEELFIETTIINSYGIVTFVDGQSLIISPHVTLDRIVCGVMAIPISSVRDVKHLEVTK